MFKTFRRDIFDIRFPGFPIEKFRKPNPNPLAAAQTNYSTALEFMKNGQREWESPYINGTNETGKQVSER
jgi:hypothetical protein